MTNEKQPPRNSGRERYGPGGRTQGRLGKSGPLGDDVFVGKPNPPFDVTGPDAISPLLEHVEFPATTDEIVADIGDARVPINRQETRTVAEVFEKVGPETFRSPPEVHQTLNARWDALIGRSGRGGRHGRGDDLTGRPKD